MYRRTVTASKVFLSILAEPIPIMDAPPPSFTQLLDRGIAAEAVLSSWCPTMDLLALATADGQLHLHRLNWQRLWWASPDAAITGTPF